MSLPLDELISIHRFDSLALTFLQVIFIRRFEPLCIDRRRFRQTDMVVRTFTNLEPGSAER